MTEQRREWYNQVYQQARACINHETTEAEARAYLRSLLHPDYLRDFPQDADWYVQSALTGEIKRYTTF